MRFEEVSRLFNDKLNKAEVMTMSRPVFSIFLLLSEIVGFMTEVESIDREKLRKLRLKEDLIQ